MSDIGKVRIRVPSSINPGEKLVVVTVNNSGSAAALLAGDFGRWGPGGPFAH